MQIFLAAILFVSSSFAARPAPVPEHVQNKAYAPTKPPILDETKPSEKYSVDEWSVATGPQPACGKSQIWKLASASVVEATAFKEKTVGVKGHFNRLSGYATEEIGGLAGTGAVDLSSWDSGLAARDYRVMKHVFGVEIPGESVLPVAIHLGKGGGGEQLQVAFSFRGKKAKLLFPVQVKRTKKAITVQSLKPARLQFLSAENLGAFAILMERCNHQFLASFADVAVTLTFEPLCP